MERSSLNYFRSIVALMAIVVLTIVGFSLYPPFSGSPEPKETLAITSIAVLPFVNMSHDPELDYFGDGLTEGVLNSLAHLEGLKVTARNSSFKFRGDDVDIKEVGGKLGVQSVLEGSFQITGDHVRITTQLINVDDEFHFWSEQYDEKLDDVFALQDKIANAIAQRLQITVLPRFAGLSGKRRTIDREAYSLYVKGRAHWNARTPVDLRQSLGYFQQALAIAPDFAEAYAGIADSYNALGYGSFVAPHETFPQAKLAAVKALALDSTLAEPHASLGFYYFYYEWDWELAEEEFRTALALNPNNMLAYDWYGYYLTAMQRYDEAISVLEKASILDPLSDPVRTDVGFSLYYSRRYQTAVDTLERCVARNPNFGPAHLWLGRSFQELKLYDAAVQQYQRTLEINRDWPVGLAALGHVYGDSGRTAEATEVLAVLNELSKTKFVTSYGMALVHAGLGDTPGALSWLDRAYKERSNWLVWLRTDPRFDRIRNEERFEDMVRKVGLPQLP